MKPITLYDVARHAGVSYQTVSRVINQGAHVSPRTREKVMAAMADLHYIPNRGAQQLAGKKTPTLGLLTTDLALHAPSQIAAAVKSRAGQAGVSVIISMLEQHDNAACRVALQELLSQRVEGLLINVPLEDEEARMLAELASPVPVLFLDVSDTATVSSLIFDAAQGARLGVSHLLAQGHRRIALLGGPLTSVSARARMEGWWSALEAEGLTPHQCEYGDWSAASGYEKGHQLLSGSLLPQAILVANDQMALGVIRACEEKGLRVPGLVSVVGYDDTADSAWYSPPLTTIRQAFREAGEQSVEWLLNQQAGKRTTATQTRLPVTLVVRASTSPARQMDITGEALAKQLHELAHLAAQLDRHR
ncbi:LacI family DNA-binding transcriptional regulator [Yokenella regensburgei]|uniref:LacI family DNA-binding transcriptional regulator n=1 Tax=Yokenella regensburgei TaxID=158877 RepID=UPI003F137FD2